MTAAEKPLVASLIWQSGTELFNIQGEIISELGFQHEYFHSNQKFPENTKIVFIQGPYGSLKPTISQILEISLNNRPQVIYWFGESLSIINPKWLVSASGAFFSELYGLSPGIPLLLKSIRKIRKKTFKNKGYRLSFAGDILWMNQFGLLDVFGLSSTVYQDLFLNFGINSTLIPRGFHPSYGENQHHKRDIAVVWMGKSRTRRRKRIIYWLRDELQKRGLRMEIFDGDERPFIYGQQKTDLLNRTYFVLNIFTKPTDELSIRYYIAAANGAVILTEPGKNEYPFKEGTHLVESAYTNMPGKIQYYIDHKSEWEIISNNANQLISRELTVRKSIKALLDSTGIGW